MTLPYRLRALTKTLYVCEDHLSLSFFARSTALDGTIRFACCPAGIRVTAIILLDVRQEPEMLTFPQTSRSVGYESS